MLPRKSLKSRVSEMPFPAHWGQNLQTSNGQKTTYKMWKFTCSLDRIIFQNVITGAVFVVNTLCNCFLIILTTPTLHEKAAKHKPYNASVLTSWYILFKYFKECTVHNNLNLLKLIQRKSGGGALALAPSPPRLRRPCSCFILKQLDYLPSLSMSDNQLGWASLTICS